MKFILEAENLEERVAMLNSAIEVMMVLSELNNLNRVISVDSAIEDSGVHRLKFTLNALNERYRNFLDECHELVSDHYRRYREKLRSINSTCVPFMGMYCTYLSNIVHIEDGNRDRPNTE